MKINSYTKTGKKSQVTAPSELKGDVNNALLAQAIHVYRSRKHQGNSKVQTRSDVTLTKSKWYRQKGTGNARHGAKSAPIFVGGGVAHGPKGVKRVLNLPLKMRRKALSAALAVKLSAGDISIADFSGMTKTKDAQKIIDKVKSAEEIKRGKLTVVLSDKNKSAKTVLSNIGEVRTQEYKDLNAYSVYFGGKLIFDKEIFNSNKSRPSKTQGKTKKEEKNK